MRILMRITFVLVTLALFLGGHESYAQFSVTASYDTVPSGSPKFPGCSVKYTATLTNPPGIINGYNWQWIESDRAQNGNVCNTLWRSFQTNNSASITVVEPWVGTFVVKCTVSYRNGMGGAQLTLDSNLLTITIPPPDGFNPAAAFGTAVATTGSMTCVFPVTCQGNTCNPSGTAQELITNKFAPYALDQHPADDTDWTPAAASPSFYLAAGAITDVKQSLVPASWANIPINSVFYSFTQKMRIIVADSCGNINAYDLGSINLQRRKVSATEWTVEQQP